MLITISTIPICSFFIMLPTHYFPKLNIIQILVKIYIHFIIILSILGSENSNAFISLAYGILFHTRVNIKLMQNANRRCYQEICNFYTASCNWHIGITLYLAKSKTKTITNALSNKQWINRLNEELGLVTYKCSSSN